MNKYSKQEWVKILEEDGPSCKFLRLLPTEKPIVFYVQLMMDLISYRDQITIQNADSLLKHSIDRNGIKDFLKKQSIEFGQSKDASLILFILGDRFYQLQEETFTWQGMHIGHLKATIEHFLCEVNKPYKRALKEQENQEPGTPKKRIEHLKRSKVKIHCVYSDEVSVKKGFVAEPKPTLPDANDLEKYCHSVSDKLIEEIEVNSKAFYPSDIPYLEKYMMVFGKGMARDILDERERNKRTRNKGTGKKKQAYHDQKEKASSFL